MSPAESAPSTVAGRKWWPLLGHCGSSPRRLPAPRSVPPGRRCCLWPVPHWSLPAAAVETVLPGRRASGPVPFSRRSAALQPYLINRSVNSIEVELNAFFFFFQELGWVMTSGQSLQTPPRALPPRSPVATETPRLRRSRWQVAWVTLQECWLWRHYRAAGMAHTALRQAEMKAWGWAQQVRAWARPSAGLVGSHRRHLDRKRHLHPWPRS